MKKLYKNLSSLQKAGAFFAVFFVALAGGVAVQTPGNLQAQNLGSEADQLPEGYYDEESYDENQDDYDPTQDSTYSDEDYYPAADDDPNAYANEDFSCDDHYDPVCGTDGATYHNVCEADGSGVIVDYWGECRANDYYSATPEENFDSPSSDFDNCPTHYDPVCDSYGATYPNSCEAEKAGVNDYSDGECNFDNNDGNDEWELQDAQRQLDDQIFFLNNRLHEIKYNFRDSAVDMSKVESLLDQWADLLDEAQGHLENGDMNAFWDSMNKTYQVGDDLNGLFNDLYDEQNDEFADQERENMKRELEHLERELERLKVEAQRAGGLNISDIVKKVEAKIAEAKGFMDDQNDFQYFWWAIEDARYILNDFQNSFHITNWMEDIERMIHDMERQVTHTDSSELSKILDEIRTLFKKAQNHVNDGQFQDAQNVLQDLQYLADDFWWAVDDVNDQYFHEGILERAEEMLEDVEEGLADAKRMIARLKEEGKDTKYLEELLTKAVGLLDELRQAVADNDVEGAEDILNKLEFGLKEPFEREFESLAGGDFEKAWDDVYSRDAFVEDFEFNDAQIEAIIEDVVERVSDEVVARLTAKNLPASVLEGLVNAGDFEEEIKQVLEVASFAEKGTIEILTTKKLILEEVTALGQQIAALQREQKIALAQLNTLMGLKEQLADFDFASGIGAEMEERMHEVVTLIEGGASSDDIESEIDEFNIDVQESFAKAMEEKYEKGINPFADVDGGFWYGNDAAQAKELKLITGTGESGFTQLDPAANANLAEVLTMFGRVVSSDGEFTSLSPRFSNDLPDWAKGGAAALENEGVNLDAIFGDTQAGDDVKREQVALLIQDLFDLPTGNAGHFTDIVSASNAERDAIGALNRAQIMTGNDDLSFGIDDPLNRAAMVRVLVNSSKLAD